nr:MAG TPA: hypothetical protein [Caudoviricetes sp.]
MIKIVLDSHTITLYSIRTMGASNNLLSLQR